jgi:hypothetical protein
LVGVLGVLPSRPVVADVILGALLERHRLGLGEGRGGILRPSGFDRVQSLIKQLPLLASPVARLGERPSVERAHAHFSRQRLSCLAGVPIEPVSEDPGLRDLRLAVTGDLEVKPAAVAVHAGRFRLGNLKRRQLSAWHNTRSRTHI